jgi:hypothetical protein
MSSSSQQRSRRRDQRRRRNRGKNLLLGLLFAGAAALVVLLVWNTFSEPLLGERIPATGAGNHVPNGNPLPQFSTNPPTSGPHYATALPEGFYEEDSNEALGLPNPHGFIIHSMEHGYVVFWYNCAIITETECETLKADIRSVMDAFNSFKVIAFPWTSTDVPVIATSWGYLLEMETWDPELAATFIERNRNHSPEPNVR